MSITYNHTCQTRVDFIDYWKVEPWDVLFLFHLINIWTKLKSSLAWMQKKTIHQEPSSSKSFQSSVQCVNNHVHVMRSLFMNKTSQKFVQVHQTAFRWQITINIELAATSLETGFPCRIQAVKTPACAAIFVYVLSAVCARLYENPSNALP